MNDTCTAMRRLLSEQIDGALATDERAELRAHLATCPNCRAFERDLQAGLAGISRLPRVSGSSAVREAVLAGVHPGGRSAWPDGWRDWTGQLAKLGGAIAGFALVAVILMTVFNGSGNGTGEPDDRFSGTGGQPDTTETPTATPEPIATIPSTADVYAPQPCVDGQFEFDLSVNGNAGDTSVNSPGFVEITVQALKSTGGVECQLMMPISLQINDRDGVPLQIEGNPVMAEFGATIGGGESSVSFAWLNWCGENVPLSVAVEFLTDSDSSSGIGQSIDVTPPCDDPNQPSKLGLTTAAEIVPSAGTCEAGTVVLTSSDMQREGDEVFIWATSGNVAAANLDSCEAGELVTVTLTDDSGTPLEIEGNGIELMLKPNESGQFQWAGAIWTNWCGAPDGANLTVSRSGAGTPAWIHVTPACVDGSQPSRLSQLELPPPDDMWPDIDPSLTRPGMTITEPPVCDVTTLDLSLATSTEHRDLILQVDAGGNIDDPALICYLEGDVTFTITWADGQPLLIDGNGLELGDGEYDITRILPVPGFAQAYWENWCGESGPFTITATVDGRGLTTEVDNGPECTDPTQPSTLHLPDYLPQKP